MNASQASAKCRQRGAAMLECCLIATALMLLGCGVFEIARWHLVRHTLMLAAHEAGRALSVNHGNPWFSDLAVNQALTPLFTPPGAHQTPEKRRDAMRQRHLMRFGLPLWQLTVTHPVVATFDDFVDPALSRQLGRRTINNDYLPEQHLRHVRLGWLQGLGPNSQQDIFEANTVHFSLTYLHEPQTPGVRAILRGLSTIGRSGTALAGLGLKLGLLPIVVTHRVVMQSHPMQWDQAKFNSSPLHTTTVRSLDNAESTQPLASSGAMIATDFVSRPVDLNKQINDADLSSPGHAQTENLLAEKGEPNPTADTRALCGVLLCCVAQD